MKLEKQRKVEIEREMQHCEHFTGIQNKVCKAGVNLRELVGGPDLGWALLIPCIDGDQKTRTVYCDKRKCPSREEAESLIENREAKFRATMTVVSLAHEHAKAAGLGRGNGGRGEMPCPLGCGGRLRYSVAGVNGHMHAACENGCTSWME